MERNFQKSNLNKRLTSDLHSLTIKKLNGKEKKISKGEPVQFYLEHKLTAVFQEHVNCAAY